MNAKMLEKTRHFPNAYLAEDILTKGYPKISEAAVCACSTKQLFLKILQNSQENTCTRIFFQPTICNFIEKETPAYIFFCEFYDFFQERLYYGTRPVYWFQKENFTKNRKRHSYYSKGISRSQQFSQKADIAKESVYLRNIYQKLTLNLILIFNSFTDISGVFY